MFSKCIVVVDEDVDVQNDSEVAWKALNNIDPQRDIEFVMGPVDSLDHASRLPNYGSKMGIDATRKWPGEGFTRPWPDVITMPPKSSARVDELWKKAGSELQTSQYAKINPSCNFPACLSFARSFPIAGSPMSPARCAHNSPPAVSPRGLKPGARVAIGVGSRGITQHRHHRAQRGAVLEGTGHAAASSSPPWEVTARPMRPGRPRCWRTTASPKPPWAAR